MAEVTLNPVFTSIRGTVGRMVMYRRYGKTISRAYIMPPNPNTAAQQKNRSAFRDAMKSWQGLSDEAKSVYNRRARALSMTGHNLFISQYMKARRADNIGDCSYIRVSCTSSPLRRGGREERLSSIHPACRSVTAPSPAIPVSSCGKPWAISP